MNQDYQNKFLKVFRTVHEMMRDRNYFNDDDFGSGFDTSSGDFFEYIKDGITSYDDIPNASSDFSLNLTFIYKLDEKHEENCEPIYVFFRCRPDKFLKDYVKSLCLEIKDKHAILITRRKLVHNIISPLFASCKRLEHFYDDELFFNITQHEFVPKHKLMKHDSREYIAFLNSYNIKEPSKLLPQISVNDPVSRYLGAREKDIMKIKRLNKISGKYITYRYVRRPNRDGR